MARSSPQSFEKRQRERRKQQKREEKLERKLIKSEDKRRAKAEADGVPWYDDNPEGQDPRDAEGLDR
jgi:hypothetical protein